MDVATPTPPGVQPLAMRKPAGPPPASPAAQAVAGLLASFTVLASLLSYTALLFGTAPAAVQASGLFAMLLSCLLLGMTGALLSTLPMSFITHDGGSIAAGAVVTTALTASLAGAQPGVIGATLLTALAGIAVLTGLVLLGLSWTRSGAVVRFLPLQVMAGLFSAMGWSLLAGGVEVATGHTLGPALFQSGPALAHVAPALGWAVVMVVASRLIRSAYVVPVLVVIGAGLYHGVCYGLGFTVEQQVAAGWLLQISGAVQWILPWSPGAMALVDWGALLNQAPAIGAAVAVTSLLVLVSSNGLELVTHQDVDLDRDLRANGMANLLTGLAGGVPGAVSILRTGLMCNLGVRARIVPLGAACVVAGVPLLAPGILGLVPRPLMGALLLLLAYGILDTWFVKTSRRLALAEWLTVVAVMLVAVVLGLPAAVFTGLALGCVNFAVIYSRGSPIRARCRGDVAQSNVDRSETERTVLREQADAVLVLYLQGFLFFGTANRLQQEVKAEVSRSTGRLRYLVLECSQIDGLDGSARAMLERLHSVAASHGVSVVYAALPAAARLGTLLEPGARHPNPGVRTAPTLDLALERCEAEMLANNPAVPPSSRLFANDMGPADARALELAFALSTVPAGEALMVQGEASDHLLFLQSGRAEVLVAFDGRAPVRVRQFGEGTMIGEIGFLLGTPRTATVQAVTACEVLTLTRAEFQRLEDVRPSATLALQRTVMAKLSRRLLDKDQLIAALLRGTR